MPKLDEGLELDTEQAKFDPEQVGVDTLEQVGSEMDAKLDIRGKLEGVYAAMESDFNSSYADLPATENHGTLADFEGTDTVQDAA